MSEVSSALELAAAAFRGFFDELRGYFLEREALFTQIELSLLCREHVLVVGPPGTAKSAIAAAVLGRIVDEHTQEPSLFSKQLSESTVQSDLIGPVDFRVLQETGRTEHLTSEGMLGAAHAFLDEVFDGREMLLRSILNVLHERELKHGRKVTSGKCECAIMTSNRYLSEVLAQSPELLLAFADRLSFVCFCPKSFARPQSRAAMLGRTASSQRPELRRSLTLQQLALLQDTVSEVQVPSQVSEGLEMLADGLERELLAQVARLPDYVPTKYFSQRTMVKALWALKAAVVREQICRRPRRLLTAHLDDLECLRHFFLLGGPRPEETELLLGTAADPRERAQLEIIRLEHRAFDSALLRVKAELHRVVEQEALALGASEEQAAARSLVGSFQAPLAVVTARALREKLLPGPRHLANRIPLLAAARTLLAATEGRVAQGIAGQAEGRAGAALAPAVGDVLGLCRSVPELAARLEPLGRAAAELCRQSLEMLALTAEGTELETPLRIERLVQLAQSLREELEQLVNLADQLSLLEPELARPLRALEGETRLRLTAWLRRRARLAFGEPGPRRGDPLELLASDSRRLGQLEDVLLALSPSQAGLKNELLFPRGCAYASETLATATFGRLEQYAQLMLTMAENLRREGLVPEPILAAQREVIERRLWEHARRLAASETGPSLKPPQVLSGEAYLHYRQELAQAPQGELAALIGLESVLAAVGGDLPSPWPGELKGALAALELRAAQARVSFLRTWLSRLLATLPEPERLASKREAERALDRLVKSRFPLLATQEGELLRLRNNLTLLTAQEGEVGRGAREAMGTLASVGDDFASFRQRLLDARSRL